MNQSKTVQILAAAAANCICTMVGGTKSAKKFP